MEKSPCPTFEALVKRLCPTLKSSKKGCVTVKNSPKELPHASKHSCHMTKGACEIYWYLSLVFQKIQPTKVLVIVHCLFYRNFQQKFAPKLSVNPVARRCEKGANPVSETLTPG